MIERYCRVYCCLGEREATVGIEQRDGDNEVSSGQPDQFAPLS